MRVRGEGSVGGSARYSEGLVASVDICPRGRQWVRSLPWAHWGGGGGGSRVPRWVTQWQRTRAFCLGRRPGLRRPCEEPRRGPSARGCVQERLHSRPRPQRAAGTRVHQPRTPWPRGRSSGTATLGRQGTRENTSLEDQVQRVERLLGFLFDFEIL